MITETFFRDLEVALGKAHDFVLNHAPYDVLTGPELNAYLHCLDLMDAIRDVEEFGVEPDDEELEDEIEEFNLADFLKANEDAIQDFRKKRDASEETESDECEEE